MNTRQRALTAAVLCLFFALANSSPGQGTAFTYQGRLNDGLNPANGNYDFRLELYDASTAGTLIGGPVTNTGVVVSNGLFTMTIDFGTGVFTGGSNWLHIGVRTNGAVAFGSLTPRQQVTPTPYAIFAEGANAAGLTGTVPSGDLSGTYGGAITLNNAGNSFSGNGSGLTGLNASQLTSGTVPDARLSPNVALLNANQTFTGANIFDRGSGGPGRLIVNGNSTVDTTPFTGLGFQYYGGSGEGAIMSSYNSGFDGYGSLSFYTKAGPGHLPTREMAIDFYGNVAIDQANLNNGVLNNSTTNGAGLTFGTGSGEGIASKRTAGGNQYGLDFYTGFSDRMSLANNGDLTLNGSELFLTSGSSTNVGYGLGFWTGLPGIIPGGAGPFLFGYNGGAVGAVGPETVCLSWDYSGDVWVSNNLSTASLTVRGDYLVVNGGTPVYAYIGDDGAGNDVQIGSQKPGVTAVAAYNTADGVYMHFYCSSITIEGGADLAEPFKVSNPDQGKSIPAGAVLVIDDRNPGQLRMSDAPYDTRVAGVVSGANGINPGIQLQQLGTLEGGKNVALTGRVYVLADASNGAIKPGDLLTTSSTPGHAMRVTDHAKASGAILGKAMTGLSEGEGTVLVLVSLQ